ncbi:MAG: 2-succinyl-6-hydroxy-2,4-cyclohexadiene-1-carboxylate synthase [Bacillaceae bacterium]|nr:2-succinyl-6-hydroxy-2,4-cyclohexadiene-1-carboxylate synthase [Bacillaceae bacterium]
MYVTTKRGNYWIRKEGEGDQHLLLLHGFTGSSETWDSFIRKWAKHFTVMALDLPGHGKTVINAEFSMETFCEDLEEILDQCGISQTHVLGYSMGGRTALSFAMLYPERVQSLILESASPGLETKAERTQRQEKDEKLAQMIETKGIEHFVEYWENIPLFQSQKQLPKKVQENIRRERLEQNEKGLAASLRHMGTGVQPSWWNLLHQLKMPVLLLTGEWDQKFVGINQKMKDRIPAAIQKVIPEAGHTIHVEQPDFFVKIVNDFILHKKSKEKGG